jgi:HrpA-like RNA helicase
MPNVLVFLPGIPDIKRVIELSKEDKDLLKIMDTLHYKIEEFHGAMKPEEKNEVMNPSHSLDSVVRIILSTKIAETAVTINNIMYVLDSGQEREYFHEEITSLSYMKVEPISKSSAIQRQGRAGRVCSGYCYKMYTEKEYAEFEDSKKPEIVRMDISEIILLNIELQDYFKMSDLLFYDKIQEKTQTITMMLRSKGCLQLDSSKSSQVLSSKGKFIIESDLEATTSMFLYECLSLGVAHHGLIAALILEKPAGYFRDKGTLSKLQDLMGIEKESTQQLGDLAPIMYILEKYDNLPFDQKSRWSKDIGVTPYDVRRMTRDFNKIKQ